MLYLSLNQSLSAIALAKGNVLSSIYLDRR